MANGRSEPPPGLIWSDTILDEAEAARRAVQDEIRGWGLPGDVVVSGPGAIAGVLTRGDIDLHLRIPAGSFAAVLRRLRTSYAPASPEAWADTLAVFAIPAARSTGLAVTPRGSVHDRRFRVTWQRLAAEERWRSEYNQLKTTWLDTERYEQEKSSFFDRLVDDANTAPAAGDPKRASAVPPTPRS